MSGKGKYFIYDLILRILYLESISVGCFRPPRTRPWRVQRDEGRRKRPWSSRGGRTPHEINLLEMTAGSIKEPEEFWTMTSAHRLKPPHLMPASKWPGKRPWFCQ